MSNKIIGAPSHLREEYPFHTRFSLKPLINYLNHRQISPNEPQPSISGDFQQLLRDAEILCNSAEEIKRSERHRDLFQRLMSYVFSPVSWDTEPVAAVIPFAADPVFVSPPFRRLFLDRDESVIDRLRAQSNDQGRVIRAYLFILQQLYGIKEDFDYPIVRVVSDPETGLDRHFKLNLDFRFVEARAKGEPRVLSNEEQAKIRKYLMEPDVLRTILPPDEYELHGFVVVQAVDITHSELLTALERDLIDKESIVSREGFLRLQQRLRILFGRPDLVAALAAVHDDQILLINSGCEMTENCIFADSRHVPMTEFKGTVFERASHGTDILRVPDALEERWPKHTAQEVIESGVRSLLIAPLIYQDRFIGTLDVGVPEPDDLGPMETMMLKQVQPLFAMAVRRALDDLENQVQGIIKRECTAIHLTVEWRFRHAALHHLEEIQRGKTSEMEPIVFRDVFPIYGITDIRGSTRERNLAIQKDLEEHLNLALRVVKYAGESKPMAIFQELARRIEVYLERIQNALAASDEFSVVRFLRGEVESVFPHLKTFGPKVLRAIEAYESAMDPTVGGIYRLRREYEQGVALLNDRLASYVDQEEAEIQTLYPHYYERHRTDGVDYLIYVGASLQENGQFNELYLKNMRLWQLKVACGMAWHTEQLKPELKVPLETAHLILLQETPLSIRFRFDEKRFDVDGAYDVRHEIIKSRIDKAVIKGKRERLTQPGKIAVVYSQPDEMREMLQHIDFLRSEGYLVGNPENVDLESLPGVQGLKALRIDVSLESEAISEGVARKVSLQGAVA
jgi:hypothetical protein